MLTQTLKRIRWSIRRPWRALTIALTLSLLIIAPVARRLLFEAGLPAATASPLGLLVGLGVFAAFVIYLMKRGRVAIERRLAAVHRRRVVMSRRPEPWVFRTARDAEIVARNWMRYFGFRDAELTTQGADGGIDVIASGVVAQVKAEAKAVSRPVVQQTYGIGRSMRRGCLVFALAGYSRPALQWANEHDIALFTFNHAGEVKPVNAIGDNLLRQADEHAYTERVRLDRRDDTTVPGPAS